MKCRESCKEDTDDCKEGKSRESQISEPRKIGQYVGANTVPLKLRKPVINLVISSFWMYFAQLFNMTQ